MTTRHGHPRRWAALAVTAALTITLSGCGERIGDLLGSGSSSTAPTESAPPSSAPTSSPTQSPTPTQAPTQTPSATRPPTPSPTTSATQQPGPTATPTQSPTPTATPTPTVKPRTTLQYGDRGEKVLQLQQQLSDLGYWLGTPDGHFGGLTQQAVFALQKAAGLSRDGVVGPKTMAALKAGTRPSSKAGGTGVEIALDRQLLLIVREGKVVRILNTSTGNGERYVSRGTEKTARTPRGSWSVYRMVDALETSELGKLYRPAYYDRGYAVHGSSSIPPYPASHGCARVSNAAMDSIWANGFMTVGTKVTVYN